MDKNIAKVVEVFKKGGIVIFPTDTAIGIGCRIDNKEAVERLFKIRKRPENKPMLALVDSVRMAQYYLLPISQEVKDKLIKPYWPGKLTIVLKCDTNKVPSAVRSGRNTLGVRLPNNFKLLELIRGVGVPIVAPSANFSGEKIPFKFEDVSSKLINMVDYVLKGDEKLGDNISTVIDCSVEPWKIIRNGAVSLSF